MFNLPEEFFLLFIFGIGAILGSFSNVIIYRWPKGKSIVHPRSQCQKCGQAIKWYDNIPLVSWFILKGRCRHCGEPFSIRYVVVEFIMGLFFALTYYHVGLSYLLLEYLVFVFGLVTVSFIDFDHYLLPDLFTLSGIVIGLVGGLLNPERSFVQSLLGVFMGGGFLWAIAYFYFLWRKEDGMGGGDIKLLAWIGAILGWKAVPFVIMSSSLIGSVVGMYFARQQKKGLKTVIPFGPYLALGAVLYIWGGEQLGRWYINLLIPELN